jgi:hypothetical protein
MAWEFSEKPNGERVYFNRDYENIGYYFVSPWKAFQI